MTSIQRGQRRQRGATLIIALVMLVLVTIVGIAMIRSSTMDEKMAGNARDRDKAFQAAEAAVQKCLAMIQANPGSLAPLSPAATGAQNWEGAWSDTNSTEVDVVIAGISSKPRCMFETLGSAGNYRVTGRAFGGSTQTEVMLQATYSSE